MRLIDLSIDVKTIAFIGLAKNTGKTVAMQTLINEMHNANISYGITSIGHDGEKFDQTNHLIKKPSITIHKGNFVATTDDLLLAAGTEFHILEKTKYQTPLGKVIIAQILAETKIEVAGPSTANGIKYVADKMLEYGVQKVLIDGAIDRKAISNPSLSDGIFISTGAVLSADMHQVVKETQNKILSFNTPQSIHSNGYDFTESESTFLLNSIDEIEAVLEGSLLNNEDNLIHQLSLKKVSKIITGRSICESNLDLILEQMKKNRIPQINLIAHNPSKLFLSDKSLVFYKKKGLIISVNHPIKILGITANPVSPLSHFFNSDEFLSVLKSSLQIDNIFDVLSPKYSI